VRPDAPTAFPAPTGFPYTSLNRGLAEALVGEARRPGEASPSQGPARGRDPPKQGPAAQSRAGGWGGMAAAPEAARTRSRAPLYAAVQAKPRGPGRGEVR